MPLGRDVHQSDRQRLIAEIDAALATARGLSATRLRRLRNAAQHGPLTHINLRDLRQAIQSEKG